MYLRNKFLVAPNSEETFWSSEASSVAPASSNEITGIVSVVTASGLPIAIVPKRTIGSLLTTSWLIDLWSLSAKTSVFLPFGTFDKRKTPFSSVRADILEPSILTITSDKTCLVSASVTTPLMVCCANETVAINRKPMR